MLVFPGVGHLYLKKYIPGLLLSLGAATATYFIMSNAMQTALDVVDNMQSGNISLDTNTITGLVNKQSSVTENSTNIAMIALLLFWIIGILDSFRVGHKIEKPEKEQVKNGT